MGIDMGTRGARVTSGKVGATRVVCRQEAGEEGLLPPTRSGRPLVGGASRATRRSGFRAFVAFLQPVEFPLP